MIRTIIFVILAAAFLSACTVDENGIRDPVAEARAAATRAATQTKKMDDELTLTIREQNALTEAETKRAKLKIEQLQAETQAQRDRLIAEAEARATEQRLIAQTETQAQVSRAFGWALSIVLVLGAVAAVVFISGRSVAGAYNAMASAKYIKIGVEPGTLLPPPLVIVDGYLLDTRSGERAKLRDPAGINRLKLASSTRNTETAQLARAAVDIGNATRDKQAADMLPAIAQSVPMLDTGGEE